MRLEPCVDAVDVERMAAFRKQPDAVAVLELAEAHRAVGPVDDEATTGPILVGGHFIDEAVVEAVRLGVVPGGRGSWVFGRGGEAGSAGTAAVVGEDNVVGDEKEGGGDDGDDGNEERGEEGVGGGRGWWGWEEKEARLRAVVAAYVLGAVPWLWLVH